MSQPWTPPPPSAGVPVTPPNNNLILPIIATIVSIIGCCLPHGLISLFFAIQVKKKATAGDLQGATNAAKQAKMWAWISIAAGIVGLIAWIVCISVFGVAAFWSR
jgi:Interferon-induced transmembrane protein